MSTPVGEQLRAWRVRRRLSQLELAIQADVSTRHLSFVETGRSKPTSQMILRLSEQLDVPLRLRNELLLAAGYAPVYPAGGLDGPELASIRETLRRVLTAHEPNPALVVDQHWNLVDANQTVGLFLEGARPSCSSHLSMCCGPACTRAAWRHGSPTSASGGHTCSAGYAASSPRPRTPSCPSCTTSCRRTRPTSRSRTST